MDATTTSSGNPQTPTCCACDAGCTNDSSGGTGAASGGSSGAPVNAGTGGLSAPGGGGITGGPMTGGGGIGVGPATGGGGITGGPMTGGGGITGGPMTGGGGITGGPMTGGGGITGGPMTGGGGITGGPMTGGGGITGGPMTGGGGITGGPMTGGGGITGGPMTGGGGITGGPATGGGGLSTAFGHSLSFSNSLGGSSDGTNGNGWFIHQLPTMTFQPSGGVGVIGNPANALWFNPAQSDGTHPPSFPFRASLNYGAVPAQGGSGRDANATGSGTAASQFTLTKDDGSALRYNPGGQLQSVADAGGNTGTAEYNPRQQLTHMRLAQADGTPTSVNVYAYVASGPNVDQLESVTLQVGGQDVSRQRFTYYGVNENYGNVNDLKHIFTEQRDQASGQWSLLGTSYHRYYKPNEGGYVSGLRFLVGPEAYARMSDLGIPPDYATDPTIANFADLYVEYDMQRRVSLQRASAGAYTYRFAYTISNHPVGTNSWRTKTVETLPDGNENHIYVNAQGQAILRVFVDVATGNEWCTYWRYDAQGRGLLRAEPSAVEGYDEALPGLATLKAHEGLVHTYEYYDATSVMAPGYFKAEGVQQGGAGEVTKIRSVNYVGLSGAGIGSVWLLDASTLYQSEVDGGSEPATTSHSYQWYEGTLQPSQRTTTWPVVPTSQNGSGLANHRTVVYDRSGRPIWLRDERGFLFHTAYDQITGAVTQQIQDVQTQGRTDVPNGWTTPAGGGLNLTTDYQSDLLGRVTHALGPVHALDLGGQVVEVRRATWTIYQDAVRQVMVGQGYVQADGSGPVLMNPVSINRGDRASLVFDQIRATRGTAVESPGALTNADTFDQSTWCRWQRGLYNALGQQSAKRTYFLIPPTAGDQGAKDVNYNEDTYGYDSMGRLVRSTTPGGTLTFTTFDAPGRSTGSWVGTNGDYATNQDPSGGQQGQQAGNNLVQVSASEYDQGQAGQDGNLTKSTLHQDATTTRVTTYMYDYRDRRIGVVPPVGVSSAYTIDNQNRRTQIEQKNLVTSTLVTRVAASYDNQRRAYKVTIYKINSTAGTVDDSLTGRAWYDPSGYPVKQMKVNSRTATKTVYDGVGRTSTVYVAINATQSGYPYPVNVDSDMVVQQSQSIYDAASNHVAQKTWERDNDATGTGVLKMASGAQPHARITNAATYPDALGRSIATANYGTNGGSAWVRQDTIPVASSTILVSAVGYDLAGNPFQQIDAQGTKTQSSFDQAGRRTKQIGNFAPNVTGPDRNQTAEYAYNADGLVLAFVVRNSVTGDQTTSFVYGVTTSSGSDIASNNLLAQKIYPASSGSNPDALTYTYNQLGQLKTSTDSNGTVHGFVYDVLGRLQHDCITTLGGGVDGAVRRISRAYEVRGLLQSVTSFDAAAAGSGNVVNEVRFAYNSFGQLVADYQAHNGAVSTSSTPSVQYAYADGTNNTVRRTSMTYPSGRQLVLSYGPSGGIDDGLGRLEAIVDASAASAPTLASFKYLGLDTRVRLLYPEPGVQRTLIGPVGGAGGDQYRGLDRFGRLIDQRWTNMAANSDLERVQFGYDRASNKLWRYNPVAPVAAKQDEFYTYDGLYQLKGREQGTLDAAKDGISSTPVAEEDFAFDPSGNWTNYQALENGSVTLDQARTHNLDNEIVSLAGSASLVAYDRAGNMTTCPQPASGTGAYTLTWDAWNRLVRVQSGNTAVATYAYDGLTRRTRKTVATGAQAATSDFFYSDQWKVLEERVQGTTATNRTEQFVWCGCSADRLVLRDVIAAGTSTVARLYAMDDGKNVTAVCNVAGAVQERFGYAAFGAPSFLDANFAPSSGKASSFNWQILFCGYLFDADAGLYQVRNRYLHVQLGRWLSRDPIGEKGGMNLFAYVGNSPLSRLDPSGLLFGFNIPMPNLGDLLPSIPPFPEIPFFPWPQIPPRPTPPSLKNPDWNKERNENQKGQCPAKEPQAGRDGWSDDDWRGEILFHQWHDCYRKPDPKCPRSSFQCCYDWRGDLVRKGSEGAGTYDYYNPSLDPENHTLWDVIPSILYGDDDNEDQQ